MRNKWKKECRQLYCVNGADYGCGGGPKAGLCKLNRQKRRRWLQEQTEMIRSVLETQRLTGRDCNRCNLMYDVMYDLIQCFCSYKVHNFILLFRCHLGMDFDIGQREGRYCVLKTA
jgi:hypothetical protein